VFVPKISGCLLKKFASSDSNLGMKEQESAGCSRIWDTNY